MSAPPKTSPFAPARFPDLAPVGGVALAAAEAGVRYGGRADVMLASIDGPKDGSPPAVAGALTQSSTRSAPVDWCADLLASDGDRRSRVGLVVNAGNANAFTGEEGARGVERVAATAGTALGCGARDVFVASTGVIGEPLPDDRIRSVLTSMSSELRPDAWEPSARAIMTTDTYPKGASATTRIGGARVTTSGLAKGSGMIAPDMATMLSFVFTDAAVAPELLSTMTKRLAAETFNAVTVDGDTSTSDTLLVFATGRSGAPMIETARSPGAAAFRRSLRKVLMDLAMQLIKDGEGVSKVVAVKVRGAASAKAARRIAKAVANSPLVKTAWAGGDPNWGRIVMAVGKAGERADRDRLSIFYGPHPVAEAGRRADAYDETTLAAYMAGAELELTVDVGVGSGVGVAWGCDLTHDYVSINADYRS